MRYISILFLLLCSCITSKKVQDYLSKEKNEPEAKAIVSDWLEQHKEWYADKAAKDFQSGERGASGKEIRLIPVPWKRDSVVYQGRVSPSTRRVGQRARTRRRYTPVAMSPDVSHFEKTIREQELAIQENITKLHAVRAALRHEQEAHNATKQQLRETETERDNYEEKNRKKFWALIAMAVFVVLFVFFTILSSRIRVT